MPLIVPLDTVHFMLCEFHLNELYFFSCQEKKQHRLGGDAGGETWVWGWATAERIVWD